MSIVYRRGSESKNAEITTVCEGRD
jgi:hypothetical protein